MDPQVRPDLIVPVARYQGSRLASGASPSPYQQIGSSYKPERTISDKKENQIRQTTTPMSVLDKKTKQTGAHDSKSIHFRAQKVARISLEGTTVGAAIVEAENSLEMEVCVFLV